MEILIPTEYDHYLITGTIGQSFYRGSNGCVLVYDVTNEASLEQLLSWRDEALSRVDSDHFFPIVIVGNKTDLKTDENKVGYLTIYSTYVEPYFSLSITSLLCKS